MYVEDSGSSISYCLFINPFIKGLLIVIFNSRVLIASLYNTKIHLNFIYPCFRKTVDFNYN